MSIFTNILQNSCRKTLLEPESFHMLCNVANFHRLPKLSSQAPAAEEKVLPEMLMQPQARPKEGRVKSLKEMPGPKTLTNLVEFFWRDGFSRIHEIQQQHTKQYGKIFKSHFGPQFVVSIADKDMVAQVLRAESEAPQRANMESWKEYRDLRGRATGLISAEGQDWLKMRSVLRQKIMKPKDVAVFSNDVNAVVTDLIKRIHSLRSQAADGKTVNNINDLYFKYAMEGVASILYEARLGCLQSEIPQQSLEYIAALHLMFSMFKTTMYAGAIPKWLRIIIPKPWIEFCNSWDGLFKFSQIHVDKKLSEIQAQLDAGEEVEGGLLTHLLVSKEMTVEEIYANMTEMLLAGVDTTSFTLSWSSYLLARHPQVQQAVYDEVVRNLGRYQAPIAEDISQLPLIRGVVKETLRLFPVLPGNGRVMHEDMVVGGYLIPKGTQLALCHYSTSYEDECFPAALEFRPERWVRKDNMDRVDNFGSIPFGYGIRSCIGKRIAELELHLALVQMLQNFRIDVSPHSKPVHAKTHGLLSPAAPINLRFVDRE
ncbi:cytochrome P450 27C1 isoform X1 [Huso huso]|uniref:Cytochrome P450 27C1 isoform X1 n=1 Tax=Huso huso TaxID=61971 RepID=A0ABR0ZJA6_HUSHU